MSFLKNTTVKVFTAQGIQVPIYLTKGGWGKGHNLLKIKMHDKKREKILGKIFDAKKIKSEHVYNIAQSEGNSLSYVETEIIVQNRFVNTTGKPLYDINQVTHLSDAWDEIIKQVEKNEFNVSKHNFISINSIVAKDDNPTRGDFRQKMVQIGGTKYMPPAYAAFCSFKKNDGKI